MGSVLNLEADSVDCFITSPPYWDLKNYSGDEASEIGHGQSLAEYSADMGKVFSECARLAKDSGVLWLVVDTMRNAKAKGGDGAVLPLPFMLADIAGGHGWRLQEVVIWRKNKTLPFSGHGQLRNLMEYILLLVRSDDFKYRPHRISERHLPGAEWLFGWPERYHPLGRNPSNVWDISIPNQGVWGKSGHLHFCPFPQELVRRCIDLTTDEGDLVVDPFAGTGTVPAQATVMNRRGMGTELNSEFAELFESQTLPEFRKTWVSESYDRELFRSDQVAEARNILTLRALKAGKEVSKSLAERALKSGQGQSASGVTSIAVVAAPDLCPIISLDEGSAEIPPIEIVVIHDEILAVGEIAGLEETVTDILSKPPLSKMGIELVARLLPSANLGTPPAVAYRGSEEELELLGYEFSKNGCATAPLPESLFQNLPRLLTTISLARPLALDQSELVQEVRDGAERALFERLLSSDPSLESIAEQLGLPTLEVAKRLDHLGIKKHSRAFSI
jgi:DNA modification methylase